MTDEQPVEPWRLIASEEAFANRWYRLRRDTVELPDGSVIDDYYVSVRPEIANVVAVTPAGEIVLCRQYKHGIGAVTLEIPGGLVDAGEEPVAAAARELAEETGYAGALEPLGSLVTDPSKNTNRAHGFLARDARPAAAQRLDPHERIAVELVPLADVRGSIARGEIDAVDSVAFLLLALDRLR